MLLGVKRLAAFIAWSFLYVVGYACLFVSGAALYVLGQLTLH